MKNSYAVLAENHLEAAERLTDGDATTRRLLMSIACSLLSIADDLKFLSASSERAELDRARRIR